MCVFALILFLFSDLHSEAFPVFFFFSSLLILRYLAHTESWVLQVKAKKKKKKVTWGQVPVCVSTSCMVSSGVV